MNIRSRFVAPIDVHQRLQTLNNIVLELMQSATLDELFQRAIELGTQELGFDRLGIAVLGEEPGRVYGTYATDEVGQLRDERQSSFAIRDSPALVHYLQQGEQRQAALIWCEIHNFQAQCIATGWNAVAGLWDGETLIGYLFADNLLRRDPFTDADSKLLTMYASSLGHLYTHLRLEQSLDSRRFEASTFLNKMATLNQVTVQLTRSRNWDELCYNAVRLGRQDLGFDRLGLWFTGEDPDTLLGSYGIDDAGNVRAEHDRVGHLEHDHDRIFGQRLQNNERYIFDTGVPIRDFDQHPLGFGWKAAAALWDGKQIIGYLFTDNLLSQAPYSVHQGELLALYAMSIGHLCSRQRIEESLREREASYRTLVDAIPDYTFVVNRAGLILAYHEAKPPTLQIPLHDCVGKTIFDVLSERLAERYLAAIEESFTRKQVTTLEYPLRHGKSRYYLEARITAGNDDQAVVLVRNVTDRKRLEEQLHASQKMESLGRMAGGVAHDFNNYLTVIQGFSGLAQSMATDASPNLRNALERIESASAKAARLTNQLLLFARKQAVTPQYFEVNKAITALKTILLPLLGSEIEFQIEINPNAGYIFMDSGQFEQVLVNLVVNARDAMAGKGCVTLSTQSAVVTADESDSWLHIPPNRYVVIRVCDTGTGMDETIKKQLFEPFFTTKEKGKGTGLGLAICHSIIQQNGGYIHVESAVGEGTTFSIHLPQTPAPELALGHADTRLPTSGVGTILLVEDDDAVREVVAEVLSTHGYTVLACASGAAALQVARESTEEIHLLVTDLAMPKMGGREVAEKFMQIRPDVPILLVSGYADGLPESLLKRPNVRFLPKPYTATTLTDAVCSILQQGNHPCKF